MKGIGIVSLALIVCLLSLRLVAQEAPSITAETAGQLQATGVLGYGYSTGIAWSPDGKSIAVTTSVGVVLYSGNELETTASWQVDGIEHANSVAFSPDGTLLAVGGRGGLGLMNVATGQVRTLLDTADEVIGLAFNPDGTLLASGSAGDTVRLWDVTTGEVLVELTGGNQSVTEVAFSPDGQILAAVGGYDDGMVRNDGTLRLWDVTTYEPVRVLGGHADRLAGVAFNPRSATLASGSFSNTVRLWDMATGELLISLAGHSGDVVSVAFSPDGSTLASSAGWEDSIVRLWEVASGELLSTFEGCARSAHKGELGQVAFSPDGNRLASTCSTNGVMVWDVVSGQQHRVSQGYGAQVTHLAFSPDGTILAAGTSNGLDVPASVQLWDLATERVASLEHSGSVESVAFSPDGELLAAGGNDGTVRVWDVATGEAQLTIGQLSSATSGTAMGGDDDGDVAFRFEVRSDAVWSAAFSPDGTKLAVARGDFMGRPGSLQLYDVDTGGLVTEFEAEDTSLYGETVTSTGVSFSPDGMQLAAANADGKIRLWEMSTGQEQAVLDWGYGWVSSVAFSPNGRLIAGGGAWSTCDWGQVCGPDRGEVHLWDVAMEEQLTVLTGPTGGVSGLSFNVDGTVLAVGGGWENGVVSLWDTETKTLLAEVESPQVTSVAFSPDGAILATGGWDGSVRLWRVVSR